jgi:succinate dehydrogenase/fumarate reductase flavoprotein subunit
MVEFCPTAPVARPGVVVDRSYAARVPRLFASGEACAPSAVVTGLAAAATSGGRAGRSAAAMAAEGTDVRAEREQVERLRQRAFEALERSSGVEPETVLLDLQEQVIPYDRLLLRHGDRMAAALERVERIRDEDLPRLQAYDLHYLRLCHEVENLTLAAELQLKASIQRTETRNILREDYPYTDNENWLKWIMVRRDDGAQKWWTEDIPIERYPWRPERKKELAYLWQRPLEVGVVSVENDRIRWNRK